MTDMTRVRLEWVNYQHLLYFWVVAREGGLVPAGRVLHLSHSTISAQIRALEAHLGEKLFSKVGRRLAPTEVGNLVLQYAEEIFTLGRELVDTVKGRSTGKPLRLNVGVVDVVPKLMVRQLLMPAFAMQGGVKVTCFESTLDDLLAKLTLHTLDIVISDAPVPTGSSVRAFNHVLGETGVSAFAVPSLVRTLKKGFPSSLDGAPMLLPLEGSALRRSLNQWFVKNDVRPRVVAEFEDSALLKVFGADGMGVFIAPTAVEDAVCKQFGVEVLGRLDELQERFYAISVERRLKHPAVVAITEGARHGALRTH